MILTVSGPSSTGKTAFIELLKKHKEMIESIAECDAVFIPESIREVMRVEYAGKALRDVLSNQDELMDLQFSITRYNERLYRDIARRKSNLYIIDRGPVDNYIYTLFRFMDCEPDVRRRQLGSYRMHAALNKILMQIPDAIFLTAPIYTGGSVEADGFRPDFDKSEYTAECELFDSILGNYFGNSDKIIRLPSSNDERLQVFFDYLCRRFI